MLSIFFLDGFLTTNTGSSGDRLQFDDGALSLLLEFVDMLDLAMSMGMLLIFDGQVVDCMILVQSTALDTLSNFFRVQMIFIAQNLQNRVLYNQTFLLEVDIMRMGRFVGKCKL